MAVEPAGSVRIKHLDYFRRLFFFIFSSLVIEDVVSEFVFGMVEELN